MSTVAVARSSPDLFVHRVQVIFLQVPFFNYLSIGHFFEKLENFENYYGEKSTFSSQFLTLDPKTFKASSLRWQSCTTRAWKISLEDLDGGFVDLLKQHFRCTESSLQERVSPNFLWNYHHLKVDLAPIIVLQVVGGCHDVVNCHFCLQRKNSKWYLSQTKAFTWE